MSWDSEQYLKFANERNQPCSDLIHRLHKKYRHILDLGCGPANSTVQIKNIFPDADIIGFDSDENMLKKAAADNPDIKFVKGRAPDDLCSLGGGFDLIFSNACIHWIQNQEKLISEISSMLSCGGGFAVQIPLTDESQFYKILYGLISEKWTSLSKIRNFYNLDPEGYYNLLIKNFSSVSLWKTDYYHIVGSADDVIEWYKGSGLRPYLNELPKSLHTEFFDDLKERIEKSYRILDDGNVFLIMPRLFFIAKK